MGCYVLITMILFNMTNIKIVKNRSQVDNLNLNKQTESTIILLPEVEVAEAKYVPKKKIVDNYQAVNTSGMASLETYTATISYYGNDCNGCSGGATAYGYDVSTRITYPDKTYGNVRVLAGDAAYPFGTVVKLTYTSGQVVVGIVLDRGGVGFGKRYQFDVLCESEAKSYQLGVEKNVKVEILRRGF